jgi:hypothetical protein
MCDQPTKAKLNNNLNRDFIVELPITLFFHRSEDCYVYSNEALRIFFRISF